jgi:adenylate cyclase
MRQCSLMMFTFDVFTLDLSRGVLSAGGHPVDLRPKTFDLLRYFVENPDRLIAKGELMSAVWPNVVVTDDSLKRCISELRLALDDAQQQKIKTIPRRGYLFAAGVSRREAVPVGETRFGGRHRPSIAILPFVNMSGDADQDYLSDGIAEDLMTMLSKFGDLLVIARNSAFQYKDRHVDAKQIGRELGVRYLLEGSVRRSGKRVRVTAQLIETAGGEHIWAETYDREMNDVFAVQDEVARKIVITLVAHVNKSEMDRALRRAPGAFEAYDLYLQGRAMLRIQKHDGRGARIEEARKLYEKALELDPHFAAAHCALADSYVGAWLQPGDNDLIASEFQEPATLDLALSHACRAVELDGDVSEDRATLGWILHWQYRRSESLPEFERAFALNPNFVEGRYRYGIALIHHGRALEGVELLQGVLPLDPFHSPFFESCLGTGYFLLGRSEEALDLLRVATRRVQKFWIFDTWRAAAAAQAGEIREAERAAIHARHVYSDLTIGRWLNFLRLTKTEDADRTAQALRRAGLPA